MKFICVIDEDGRIKLPPAILSQMDKEKGYMAELEYKEKSLKMKDVVEFIPEGLPVPYEALEESGLLDESNIEVLVMDGAIILTTHDQLLQTIIGEMNEDE